MLMNSHQMNRPLQIPTSKGSPMTDPESHTTLPVRVPPQVYEEFPGQNLLPKECFLNFYTVAEMLRERFRKLVVRHGVPSDAAFNVLAILEHSRGPVTPSEIAQRMILSRATVTGLLDTLEKRGYIRRVTKVADARTRPIVITSKGTAVWRKLNPLVFEFERHVFGCLSGREQGELIRTLGRIHRQASSAPLSCVKGSDRLRSGDGRSRQADGARGPSTRAVPRSSTSRQLSQPDQAATSREGSRRNQVAANRRRYSTAESAAG
jgi:DNA-binding MarR family transcriptional regulator